METLKKWIYAILVVALTFGLMYLGEFVGLRMFASLYKSSDSVIHFIAMYGLFIGIWIVTLAYCYITKFNRKYFKYLGKQAKGNNLKTILCIGLPCGLGLNLLGAILAIAHGDIQLSFAEFNLPLVLIFLLVVAIQCGAEELIDRWFLYHKIKDIFPEHPWIAVVASAMLFSLMHIMNPGVSFLSLLNIAIIGTLYALITYYYDSFWACVLAHTGWNFCQSILLGLPNSGIVSSYSIFKLDTATQLNSFVYDTAFGLEGTIYSCVVGIIACIVIWQLGRKKARNI